MSNIAVLLSSYNGSGFIRDQIESILNQQGTFSIYLFIRDDGSTDNTPEIIRQYESDTRVNISCGENVGIASSFYRLLKTALNSPVQFSYYAFSDQDDYWFPDKIKVALEKIEPEEKGIPVLYGSRSYITDDKLNVIGLTNNAIRPMRVYNSLVQNLVAGHTQVINREMANLLCSMNIDCSQIYVFDYFVMNTALICGKLIFDEQPHIYYRQHKTNCLGCRKSNILLWFSGNIAKIVRGEKTLFLRQMLYVIKECSGYFTESEKKDIDMFFNSTHSFFSRLHYIFKTPFFRQGRLENLAFRVYYLLGGYTEK